MRSSLFEGGKAEEILLIFPPLVFVIQVFVESSCWAHLSGFHF